LGCFPGRNPGEEGGVEAGDVPQKATGTGVRPTRPAPACINEVLGRETIRWDLAHHVPTGGENPPQVIEAIDVTRETTGGTDYRNSIVGE
jgi:hypothetical protein